MSAVARVARATRARLQPIAEPEDGVVMVLVVLLIAMLSVVSITLMETVRGETGRSATAVNRQTAFEAAEAGLNDYISKLVDDHLYYVHYVHPGESTRRSSGGVLVSGGSPWPYDLTWTYPNGKDTWRQLSNGYEYNLQITPPSASQPAIDIVATGRKTGDANVSDRRVVESLVKPSSIADFQMLANADIVYGSSASTYGKIYAGIDSGGVAHNVTHYGTAYANVYAEGGVYGSPTLMNGAQTYDASNIRSVIKNPINFQDFLSSLSDISRAAQYAGVYLPNSAAAAYRLTFLSNGTFQVQSCTQSGGQDVAASTPTCSTYTPTGCSAGVCTVPSNGAVYSELTAIVSGSVKGRVTVASNNNVVIASDINPVTSGTDVVGLVAKNEMIVAQWAPYDLTWTAGTIAQTGQWRSWSCDGSHGTMTFNGSTATNGGGYMCMFTTRVYNYDPTLQYLQPPWFPSVGDPYQILLFRELPPS